MQIYDIVMLVVLAGSIFYGARKGMAWQIASIASLVVSYFASLKFSDQVAPMIKLDPPLNRIAAMLGLYLASSLVIWIGRPSRGHWLTSPNRKSTPRWMAIAC